MVRDFVSRVQQAVLAETADRVRSVLASTLGGSPTPNVPRKTSMNAAKAATSARSTSPAKPAPGKPGRKLQLTEKGLAARKLQGKYMGLLRGLPENVRGQVKTYAHEHGVAAAIKYGRNLK